jgi:hypothetical protein
MPILSSAAYSSIRIVYASRHAHEMLDYLLEDQGNGELVLAGFIDDAEIALNHNSAVNADRSLSS